MNPVEQEKMIEDRADSLVLTAQKDFECWVHDGMLERTVSNAQMITIRHLFYVVAKLQLQHEGRIP